jgi:hypothetical protein
MEERNNRDKGTERINERKKLDNRRNKKNSPLYFNWLF